MKPVELALLKTLVNNIPKPKDGLDGKDGVDGLKGDKGEDAVVDYQKLVSYLPSSKPLKGDKGDKGDRGEDAVVDYQKLAPYLPEPIKGDKGDKGEDAVVDYGFLKSLVPKAEVDYTKIASMTPRPKDGRGIKSVKVNEKNMLVVTYDDGEMAIAGKVSVTREATTVGGGLPLGSFGLTGTKTNDAGELVILGTWGKEFNTGFTSGGGVTLRNPNFTYTSGALTSVAYTGGHTKVLAYNGDGTLNTIVTTINGQATTKTLAYNLDGSLASVTES